MYRNVCIIILAALASALLAGCGAERSTPLTAGSVAVLGGNLPELPSPEEFVPVIDNAYLAFTPGKVFTYQGQTEDGLETIVVEVTRETKTILGVVTTVVHDQAFLDGNLVEDTLDWFARDQDGNVWYFGEDSEECLITDSIGAGGGS